MSTGNGNYYSDATGYNATQLNIATGTMGGAVVQGGFKFGTHVVTAAQQTAGAVVINPGIVAKVALVQVLRANKLIAGQDVQINATTGVITIATNGSTYVVTTADVVMWMAAL